MALPLELVYIFLKLSIDNKAKANLPLYQNKLPIRTFEFTLNYYLREVSLSMDDIDDRLFESGCDDALVAHSGTSTECLMLLKQRYHPQFLTN